VSDEFALAELRQHLPPTYWHRSLSPRSPFGCRALLL